MVFRVSLPRFAVKASWDRSRACHASASAVAKKKGKTRKKRRREERPGGERPTREIDKFDEAPLFRAQAGSFSLSAGFPPFIYISLSFFFLLLTKDEAPLCTIKSLMSEDVVDGERVGRGGWKGRKPVTMGRGESARGS